jgi:hypothetical protein
VLNRDGKLLVYLKAEAGCESHSMTVTRRMETAVVMSGVKE